MKKVCMRLLTGIPISCTLFCLFGIVFDIINQGRFLLENGSYTRMVLGALAVGAGFSVPSVIYDNDRLPRSLQVLFHMGIGCAVMLLVAFAVGWIPTELGLWTVLAIIAAMIATAFVVWLGFCAYYRCEAQRLNAQVQQRKTQ